MKTRIVAAIALLALGTAASAPALAFPGVHDSPRYEMCPASSASEGNADQQTRPVKQYGQTAGGNRC